MVAGLLVGVTLKLRHDVPEGSPNVLWLAELPSLPATASVNGPRLDGPMTHACRVVEPPQITLQPAVQTSVEPKPTMQTCWCRHWPPGGFWSTVVQVAAPVLVFQAIVVQVLGE